VRLASGVISLGTAPLTVARKKGYFAEEGVDLEWQLVQGGAAVAAALTGGDIPEWADFPHAFIYLTKDYGQRNADGVGRVGRAITRGAQLIRADAQEARRVLQEEFKDTDPQFLQTSVDRLKDAYSPDGKFTQRQWENAMKLLVESGTVARAVETHEGGVWTNQYLK
jgi:ABC-type nitrate/sulfonate/bicarbonate transport system substrate-binding protein